MKILRFVRRILLAPITLMLRALDDFDADELIRIVDKRSARAESAVLRDYFAQHGIEGEDADRAAELYRDKRRERTPDAQTLGELRRRAESAEREASRARLNAEARVQMARLGIAEQYAEDVLLLASKDLQAAEQNDGDPEAVRAALQSVIDRLPSLAAPQQGITAGMRGNFPRGEDTASSLQHQLDKARAAGDNATAVSIITGAASKGIQLR
ncbi:MAG: hypothetical protein IJP17_04610 [Clostridia bacterium]|nr:hypothetical protein [Clostridia bacterium]